jgi:hypothetical protein
MRIIDAVRDWQSLMQSEIFSKDGNELEAISKPFEFYYILDGMSRCPEITILALRRFKLHAIKIISLSDDGFAGRAWHLLFAEEV